MQIMFGKLPRPFLRLAFLIGSLLLVTLIACRADGPEDDQTPAPTIQAPSLVPQEVPMTTLLRNPASFGGQTIWLTGQYRSLPLQVCGSTTHRSPATWTLVFGDVETFVSGFDEALRPLAATGLSLTIEGRWQKWTGPVGCGRRAATQEIWYLAAARIVSPNPLVRSDSDEGVIVLVPSPTPEVVTPEGLPTATTEGEEPGTEPGEEDFPTPIPSPTFQSIPTFPSGSANTATPLPSSTPDTGGGNGANTSTPTSSATPTLSTEGTAVTGTPTPSPSATTTGGTPSATGTPTNQGVIIIDSIEKRTLAANSPHSWRFTPPANDQLTITAGSTLALNLSIDLVAPDGTVVAKANQAAAGKPETITYTTPNPTGEYKIVVSGESGTSGAYLLTISDSDSELVYVIRDTIVYGSGGSGSNPIGVDHLWNFEGQAGDVINIQVSPTSTTGNLYIYLIPPSGQANEIDIDETGVGESESLLAYTLPETGLYTIGIGELDYGIVDYTMTLTQ